MTMGMQQVLNLRNGQRVQIVSPIGETRVMKVMIGDAYLRGEGRQIWLIDENTGHYLRKLPDGQGELGKALFHSFSELFTCIEQHAFYFG